MARVRGFITFFIVAFILFCAYVYYTGQNGDMVYVKSLIDGYEYLVRNVPDKQDAADMLAKMREKMLRLVDIAVAARDKEDEFCARTIDQLKRRFNPNVMSESLPDSPGTSYSVDKGRKIFFCLRSKPEGVLLDLNTLIYVSAHELSHVASSSFGHDSIFWSNFKWLLRLAVQNGLYQYQDFAANPKRYCGMTISSAAYIPGQDDDVDLIKNTLNSTKSCR